MKRLPEIITFCCIIICLLTSATTINRPVDHDGREFTVQMLQDTTGLVSLLKVDSFRLEIIPPSSGIQFFRNGIVFLSNTKYEGKMLPKHVSFGSTEAYTAIVKDSSLGFHIIFSPSSSFSFPCEAITFDNDFKTMYFTKIARKAIKEKIYRSELKPDGKGNSVWVMDENPLDFCKGDYRYTHPAISADGKMMIFASDMEGSLGGMDLFIVMKTGEKWSKPRDLGKSINTPRDECFPFVDNDNNLFYSSNGLAGYGGYDIFTCKFNGDTWEKPMNLTRRINSENDDIAFSIDKTEGKSAFFTKRQKSGNGEMQLFRVVLKQAMYDNNPLSISYIFNGQQVSKTEFVAQKSVEQTSLPEKESVKNVPAEVKKDVKVVGKKTSSSPVKNPQAAKFVLIKTTRPIPDELKDVVVYRVQFLTTTNPRKEDQIVINGVTYKTFEYFYLNAYRYTIGEFRTLAPAKELQSICKKWGYPAAFTAAFKNDSRSLDLTLFK